MLKNGNESYEWQCIPIFHFTSTSRALQNYISDITEIYSHSSIMTNFAKF